MAGILAESPVRRKLKNRLKSLTHHRWVIYAFCSLPEGLPGKILKYVIDITAAKDNPLTHLLSEAERPFHRCEHSSLTQFSGGLTTVVTLAKCCQVTEA